MNPETVKKIVVVGGGFAGINFIKHVCKDQSYDITLVDRNNYTFFPPLLYQVSTAFIEPSNITYPFRRLFQHKDNLRFHMGSLERVDTAKNQLVTDTGVLSYDILVIAMGTETNYFGLENVKKNALPMKTIDDALLLRNHLLLNMENAINVDDLGERAKHLNIVIAGGGPTGVEVAGMLAELGSQIASKEYPEIRNLKSHIYLVDAGPVLLGPMSKKSQAEATKVLNKLGVQVRSNTAVKDYQNSTVTLSDGSTIFTNVLIWASGVVGREVPGLPAESIVRGRRITVNEFNKVQGTDNVYALGDIASMTTDPKFPKGHPQLAQVAIQQGTLLGKNLHAVISGKPMKPFAYNDKGSMAIISKYKAVADLPKVFFKGFFAWMAWLFIHIIPLVGFRNKIKLAFSWLWSFITNDPTLRLIIRPGARAKESVFEKSGALPAAQPSATDKDHVGGPANATASANGPAVPAPGIPTQTSAAPDSTPAVPAPANTPAS